MSKMRIILFTLIITILSMIGTAVVFLFNIDTIHNYRDVWIETAMNTFHHKWLAEWFFPKETIQSVMNKRVDTIINPNIEEFAEKTPEKDKNNKSDIFLQYMNLQKGDLDFAGNEIFDVDIEQEIAVSNLSTSDYKGKVAIIPDPSRVKIAHTSKKGIIGNNILTFLSKYDAILAVNASGFADYRGVGDGGEIMGVSCSNGEYWGEYRDDYNTIAFNDNDELLVGQFGYWKEHNVRDGMQFNPALIINGEKLVSGTAGWGLQPRTAIGQRKDGAIVIITIDGRKPGYSIGATMEQLADIMLDYGVINAAACDGGSSTIMGYKGNIITRCSSPQEGGRYLPNAFIVTRKEANK
ncbi:MAG: phosphodiester glycosidase family protein [Alphaproteobacteria bacterium]|nr:phosphodiester glycosidase family protein [Alphaproteobacteria bacterium]